MLGKRKTNNSVSVSLTDLQASRAHQNPEPKQQEIALPVKTDLQSPPKNHLDTKKLGLKIQGVKPLEAVSNALIEKEQSSDPSFLLSHIEGLTDAFCDPQIRKDLSQDTKKNIFFVAQAIIKELESNCGEAFTKKMQLIVYYRMSLAMTYRNEEENKKRQPVYQMLKNNLTKF